MGVKWMLKAGIHKAVSQLPDPQRANRYLQRMGGRLEVSDAAVRKRLEWSGRHVGTYHELAPPGHPRTGFRVLELGSGWHPIVPLGLVLAGAGEVLLCDLEDLSDEELLADSLDRVLGLAERDGLEQYLPVVLPDRVELLRDARAGLPRRGRGATLEALGLSVATGDVRNLRLQAAPDLFVSNTVLEHIAPDVIVGILRAFADNAQEGSVMSHLVDTCDHYLYVDDSISPYNFLRFTERQWRWIDNDVQPMNRLRIPQFRDLYHAAGVPVTREDRVVGDARDLGRVQLAAPFDAMDPDDVACLAAWFDTVF